MDWSRGHLLDGLPHAWTPSWIIEPLWQAHGLNLLFGAPRSRKSTLRGYLTVCALAQRSAFGTFPVGVRPQRAAVLLGEEVVEAEAARLWRVADTLKVPPSELAGRVLLFGPDSGFRLDNPGSVKELGFRLRSERVDLLTIDPLINFHGAPENDASAMAAIMARVQQLCEFATVVVVHHTAKPMTNGATRSVSHQARGSSVIGGYTATNLLLERDGSTEYHKLVPESKYSRAELGPLWLKAEESGVWAQVAPRAGQREAVVRFLAANPAASANEVFEALGGRRSDILKLVKELRPPTPPWEPPLPG